MKKQLFRILTATAVSLTVWSCNQSDPAPKGDYAQGVFVINEGNFTQNNGSISYFSREGGPADDDIFKAVNGLELKGGVQGYAVAGNNGLILVDNSAAGLDKVEIVEANTFKKVATIGTPDIENPRRVIAISSAKAYVSCWGTNADYTYRTGYVAVIDLATNKVIKKIDILGGPENMVLHEGKVFVGTVSYGGGKALNVINTSSDQIVKTISTPGGAPSPIGIDANGKLWVGAGIEASKIDPVTYAVETTLKIGENATKSAGNFVFGTDKKTIFFVLSYYDANYVTHGETYKFGIADTKISLTTPLIKRVFTGLAVDPSQGLIYAGVTPSYAQAGYAVRYRTDGSVVDSIKVGIAPTGFFFK
ncbi:hypothetical protein DYBT9275_05223 [Dyadobacter sp. CECT 9275]|uniref:40-residue YVTN family beta-propeller repeat-containing protein n=1 Tax=Dyadobacter helix TaxID=2822344 RepID=A0A916NE87_9BACT|nr:DUF5074 domain-containing protein [Dyadobacter sp. CECT 9275]CAG5012667.1 hypothetical protein DYBT9275_05223 [Dyadobacter sp. CECT 9275]